jgi:enoyl-CoA hydratase
METDTVLGVSREGSVATVELTRGKVNALDVEVLDELRSTFEALKADAEVAAVVLTGAGRAFSAGVDLRRVVDSDPRYAERLVNGLRHTFETLFGFPKPTIAAINGAAVAGGCILACACDVRIMADSARIGASELVVGVPFPVAALEIVRYVCGSRSEDVIYSGRLLDANEAMAIGMVHELCPADDVLERASAAASELAQRAPVAYRLAKEQLRRPTMQRMQRDAALIDGTVVSEWGAPHTAARLRAQLERMSAGR